MKPKKLHYAWVIAFSGILTLFSCLGLGRFALGMILPAMGDNLALSYSEMGYISTGNFVGYLAAVLICGHMAKRLGERVTIFLGLLLVGSSMLLVSQSESFLVILLLYLLTGIGSGTANITVMGLVAHWFSPRYRGQAAGYMIIGNGLGIICSGLTIPWLNSEWAELGWRIGWAGFGAISLLTALAALMLIRNAPAELQLQPFGQQEGVNQAKHKQQLPQVNRKTLLAHLGSIYFLFGFTYVIYATFIVTTLVEQYKFAESIAGWFWVAIGFLSIFSGTVFGAISDRFGRKTGMITVFVIQSSAYLLAASEMGQIALFISMILFGISAFSIPAIIAATISDMLPPKEAATLFGYITFFFGIGQITGPTIAGYLAEFSNSFTSSYLLAAVMSASAIALCLMLKKSN